ncbi:MAG: hypothetical protein LBC88_09950, partial [Spirochaetaceae bacterium]|nr:hypothetical protein [Spirochaetaceae bacterium]
MLYWTDETANRLIEQAEEEAMERDVDVVVAGGGTAGLYFAGLMARQGYKTLAADSAAETDAGNEYYIIHIGKEHFARF